jgi:ArsR family metal-binding transcriptional regulator
METVIDVNYEEVSGTKFRTRKDRLLALWGRGKVSTKFVQKSLEELHVLNDLEEFNINKWEG